MRGFDTLVYIMTLFGAFPRTVFLAAVAIAMFQTALAPRWLASLAIVAALVNLLGVGGIFDIDSVFGLFGFLGMVLFTIWTLLTSVVLLRRSAAPRRLSKPMPV